MSRLIIVAFVASLVLSGCGPSRIDASSEEALKESLQEVRDDLPEAERREFDEAMQAVTMDAIAPDGIFTAASQDKAVVEAELRSSLEGKTAVDLVRMAEEIRVARAKKQKTQVESEIKEIEAKQANAAAAKEALLRFEVARSRYYKEEQRYLGAQPVIELSVKNGTEKAVARAYFEGIVASPGRSVPWLKDTFNYEIRGGLEPGEAADWKLAPNQFSDWGRLDAPADAVLTVTVIRLDGADGEPLFDARGFDEDDEKRLAALRSQIITLEQQIQLR